MRLYKSITILIVLGSIGQTCAFAAEKIHIVSSKSVPQYAMAIESFRETVEFLRKDVQFTEVSLSANASSDPPLNLSRNGTQLIFALGTTATRQVLSQVEDIPVISTLILSEEQISKHNSATGIVLRYPMSTQLSWLKKILPDVRRVGILYSANKNVQLIEEARQEARARGLEIVDIEVDSPRNLPAALDEMYRRSDVLLSIPDPAIYSGKTLREIMLTSFRNRVPLIGLSRNWVKAGAIYAIESDFQAIGEQSGKLADSIIRNRKLPDQKYYFPDQVRLVINEKTMIHMRREIDQQIIDSASQVFR